MLLIYCAVHTFYWFVNHSEKSPQHKHSSWQCLGVLSLSHKSAVGWVTRNGGVTEWSHHILEQNMTHDCKMPIPWVNWEMAHSLHYKNVFSRFFWTVVQRTLGCNGSSLQKVFFCFVFTYQKKTKCFWMNHPNEWMNWNWTDSFSYTEETSVE